MVSTLGKMGAPNSLVIFSKFPECEKCEFLCKQSQIMGLEAGCDLEMSPTLGKVDALNSIFMVLKRAE